MFIKSLTITTLLCLTSFAFAETDPCSTLADLQSKSNTKLFVGYGTASSQKEADTNSQVDMASRIRQKVSASSMVTSDNNSSNLESSAKSIVNEILIGANVLKRCSNKGTYSTVVTLEKSFFVSSLDKKLDANEKKAKEYINKIKNNENDEVLANTVDAAKKFIKDYQSSFESDLQLCKIYDGCANIKNDHEISSLVDLVSKQGDKDQYIMITNNKDISETYRDELIDLVEQNGIKVMDSIVSDDVSNIKRRLYAKCAANIGSKIPGSTDRVVTVKCTVESYIGKQKGFRNTYSCSAMADSDISKEDAVNSCSGRLKKD